MCTWIFNAPLTAHMNIAQLYLLVLTQNCMVSSTNMFICIQMHTNSTICTHKATYVVTFWCICISTSACITHSVNVWNIRHHVHTHTREPKTMFVASGMETCLIYCHSWTSLTKPELDNGTPCCVLLRQVTFIWLECWVFLFECHQPTHTKISAILQRDNHTKVKQNHWSSEKIFSLWFKCT